MLGGLHHVLLRQLILSTFILRKDSFPTTVVEEEGEAFFAGRSPIGRFDTDSTIEISSQKHSWATPESEKHGKKLRSAPNDQICDDPHDESERNILAPPMISTHPVQQLQIKPPPPPLTTMKPPPPMKPKPPPPPKPQEAAPQQNQPVQEQPQPYLDLQDPHIKPEVVLPHDWMSVWSKSKQRWYFFDKRRNTSVWEWPPPGGSS